MRVLSPTSKTPHLGIWHGQKEPLEHLSLKASKAGIQELHRTGGNGDPILKRRTWTFTSTESQGKARSPWESGSNLTAVLGGHHGKTGVNVVCCEGKTLGNIQQLTFSGGGHFGKIWPHLSVSAEKPQGKQQPRWDHSLALSINRLPKYPSGTQLPLIPSRN